MQAFSEKIIGIRQSSQIMQLIKSVFNAHLNDPKNQNFADYDELQNKAMNTLK